MSGSRLVLGCLVISVIAISTTQALECYTGYSVIRGQTVGTTTETCKSDSDQCYKAKAEINLLNKLKLAGCSTFRCMVSLCFSLTSSVCIYARSALWNLEYESQRQSDSYVFKLLLKITFMKYFFDTFLSFYFEVTEYMLSLKHVNLK